MEEGEGEEGELGVVLLELRSFLLNTGAKISRTFNLLKDNGIYKQF